MSPTTRVASLRRIAAGTLALALSMTGTLALAGGNDLVLSRLGQCDWAEVDGQTTCVSVTPDTEGFESLSRDLGLLFSPKGMQPAETLGPAGFEYGVEFIFNVVDSSADYWQDAVQDQDPSDLMTVTQFHLRKGLPFSFEVGAILSHWFESSMWAVGTEIKWALHEDTLWPVPDLAVRGFVNTVVGSTDLNLTTAGFDLLLSVPVGVRNAVTITPYAGYNFTAIFSSSRLLDASPGDPRPPIEDDSGQSVKPEFVFDDTRNNYSRFVGGIGFRYAIVNIAFEALVSPDVQSYSLHLGMGF